MKKTVAFFMCLMMLLSLFSCRIKDQKGEGSITTNDQKEEENVLTNDQKDEENNTPNDQIGEEPVTPNDTPNLLNDVAMQMYEAAIHDEICVIDEHLGEIKLKNLRFPSNDTRLEECKLLTKAISDMDQDGFNEYVIKSPDNEHIILHYNNGKVYSYCLDISDSYYLNTDGTFYWSVSSADGAWEGGLNQIIFEGETLNIKSIYSLKYSEKSTINYYESDYYEYYINGEAVTTSEYFDFDIYRTNMTFTPFELTCSYPVTAEQAWKSANAYWNNLNGVEDGGAGTRGVYKVVLLDTPNSDTNYYRIALQVEFSSNFDMRQFYNPPYETRLYKQLFVNAFTGEVREYDNVTSQPSQNDIAMEMYEQTLNGLASYRTPYSEISLCECENLGYAYVDLDGDSVNELIIDCGDTLILRYYEGTVHIYEFIFRSLYYLKTDGSYSWNHNGVILNMERTS